MASSSPQIETPHSRPAACADCGAPLTGSFCSQCGEETIDRHSLTLRHFLGHNLLHELSHVDGKIFLTFRYLLFRPGFLSAEYFAGRRRKYVNPVRLLLTGVLILALLPAGSLSMSLGKLRLNLLPPGLPSAPSIEDTIGRLDVFGLLGRLAKRIGEHKDLKTQAAEEKFNHQLKTFVTTLSFLNVFLLSGLLAVIYRRTRPLFVEHLVFSLHLASFVLLLSILPGPIFRFALKLTHGGAMQAVGLSEAFLLLAIEMIYLYKALLRFYQPYAGATVRWWSRPAWTTRLAVVTIFLANSVFITIIYAAGAAIALWRL